MCLLRDSNRSCDEVVAHYECENARKFFFLDERRPTLDLTAGPKVEAMRAEEDPRYTACPSEAGWRVFLLNILIWGDYRGQLMT